MAGLGDPGHPGGLASLPGPVTTTAPQLDVRDADDRDAYAVGVLLLDCLAHNPSARLEPHDLPHDPILAGRDAIDLSLARGDVLLVAELDGHVAGLAHVRPKELLRSSHVATLTLYLHPSAPSGALCAGLEALARERATGLGLRKLTVDVTEGDSVLEALIGCGEGWRRERLRPGAMRVDGANRDVTTWARDL